MDEADARYDEQLNAEAEQLAIIRNELDAFNSEARILVHINLTAQDEEALSGEPYQCKHDDFEALRLVELMNGYPEFPEDEFQTVDEYVAGLEVYSLKRAAYHEQVVCLAQRILPRLQALLEEVREPKSTTTGLIR